MLFSVVNQGLKGALIREVINEMKSLNTYPQTERA